ncbi:MAG: DNA methylase [Erysipelotrichaceae bacterium]|nr:DNA methylase [Erysipelotrichaceae bacterium]
MEHSERTYLAIDLKSFYASVECRERNLDPLNVNLVVADESRTDKTICLAVSPALKTFGIPGRARLFEVKQKVSRINKERRKTNRGRIKGESIYLNELTDDPSLDISFLTAVPRMSHYMEYSRRIYEIYMRYVSPEDIHVYSIDEVFIDVSEYLNTYRMTARQLAMTMIREVLAETGITATAGIGTNLYLAKVAMDIEAKHLTADKDGVRIAQLDEYTYRKNLWNHQPLTDFWRVGKGITARLAKHGIYTMGDLARFSLKADGVLYDEFGINAELLIDHAWGYESCTMKDIKSYRPESNSLGSGQVLAEPYSYRKAEVVIREMINDLVLDLLEKDLVTDHVSLMVNYDAANELENYEGKIVSNWYGRVVPKPGGGSVQLKDYTSSNREITDAFMEIYKKTVDPHLLIRRINICADRILPYSVSAQKTRIEQTSLFSDPEKEEENRERKTAERKKEEQIQKAILRIKKRYGLNAIISGTDLEEGATGIQRHEQIGGHRK